MTTFTAHDRCDKCGAQAQVRATRTNLMLDTGFAELMLCGHHARQNVMLLSNEGWTVEHRTAQTAETIATS